MKETIKKIKELRKKRPIRTKFTREMAEDLKSFHGLDVSKLLEDSLVEELKKNHPDLETLLKKELQVRII
jgi:hypothetical protein